MLRHAAAALILTCVAISNSVAQSATTSTAPASQPGRQNLAQNPGMELMLTSGQPQFWTLLNIGAPAELTVDSDEKHDGKQSMRLSAKEVTRSYLHGSPMLVAPREKLTVSAWVKVKDVPPDQGTVIAIAEFSRGEGTKVSVAKVGTAKVGTDAPSGWQQIVGTVEVPAD